IARKRRLRVPHRTPPRPPGRRSPVMHLRLRGVGPKSDVLELDLSVGYGLPRKGLPGPASFRRWVEAALAKRLHRADLTSGWWTRRKAGRSTATTAARTTPPTCCR